MYSENKSQKYKADPNGIFTMIRNILIIDRFTTTIIDMKDRDRGIGSLNIEDNSDYHDINILPNKAKGGIGGKKTTSILSIQDNKIIASMNLQSDIA